MVAIQQQCPKCGGPRLYQERHADGIDHYCPICGYRRTFTIYEADAREPEPLPVIPPGRPGPKRKQEPKRHLNQCQHCGAVFLANRKEVKYCPRPATCRAEAQIVKRRCEHCGRFFDGNRQARYCPRPAMCRQMAYQQRPAKVG